MPNPEMKTLTVGENTFDIRDDRIGDLADLDTTDKSSVVAAINEAADLSLATAADVAAKIAAPSSPATGAFLVWDGSAWTAQTLSTWQGGSY